MLTEMSSLSMTDLEAIVGGLSAPSKMPGYAYSLPARECKTGSKLRNVQGSTCSCCYAMKGRYVFPKVQAALYRRLESLSDPRWIDAMAELINRRSVKHPHFRWHDSGDIQSLDHLRAIVRVCELTPHVSHWIPTREYRIVAEYRKTYGDFPPNLNVRMSAHMIGGKAPHFDGLTISTVSTDSAQYPDALKCPAPSQGNECGDCRACWNPDVLHVDYHKH
jgi:hypothetical protein